MKWLPNALTILRCILAFVVGWAILEAGFNQVAFSFFEPTTEVLHFASIWNGWPFILFVISAALDYFDGLAARTLNAHSAFGAWLDPLADKLLIGIALIALCASHNWHWILLLPTILIIGRDGLVTALRSRVRGGIAVSRAAKWKTAIAMIAVGGLLLSLSARGFHVPEELAEIVGMIALALLYFAAALSLFTAYQYVRAAFR